MMNFGKDLRNLSHTLLLGTLPIGFPPVLSDPAEDPEHFLISPECLAIHNFERSQRFLPREPNYEACYALDVTAVQTGIVVERDATTGKLLGFKEEFLPDIGKSAKNSTSLRRLPGSPQDGIRGSTTNYPFWPGGLDEPNLEELRGKSVNEDVDFSKDLATIPPGFSNGVTFGRKNLMDSLLLDAKAPSVVYLSDLLGQGQEIDLVEEENEAVVPVEEKPPEKITKEEPSNKAIAQKYVIEEVLKLECRIEDLGSVSSVSLSGDKDEWVSVVDVRKPVADFHKRIPCMALTFPFELDTFQKQAIIHLENHDNVLVAAHTSAGKTVVAEYAIAMSQRHMTRY